MRAYRMGELLVFECPGCECSHQVPVEGPKAWQWNGRLDRPTLFPSVKISHANDVVQCHTWIRDGKIQFLHDCEHKMKNQTVDLPEIEE